MVRGRKVVGTTTWSAKPPNMGEEYVDRNVGGGVFSPVVWDGDDMINGRPGQHAPVRPARSSETHDRSSGRRPRTA